MNDLNNIQSVYFIGIGGIGMSALARYFHSRGIRVSGYDKTPSTLTRQLQAEGIEVHFKDNISVIDKDSQLVIYTPAIPANHTGYKYFVENNYTVLKRSEVLGMITAGTYSICIAGTHGKTTTSAMIAHILRDSEFGCNAFLGGIASNYNTNFWSNPNNVSIAEADEYDRSFLKLNPDIAIITSMDADHLDIYGTEDALGNAFIQFASRTKKNGLLILKYGLARNEEFKAPGILHYSLHDKNADAFAENISISNGSYQFDVLIKGNVINSVKLNMGGKHNIENAVAAIVVAKQLGIDDDKIKHSLGGFKGVKRRFEYIIKDEGLVMIDDYAHHPEELRALIIGAKELFPGKQCSIVFQPHLFSRTKDLATGFSETLDLADKVYLLPIYPARELPIEGVRSEMIADGMRLKHVRVLSEQDLLEEFRLRKPELLIMAGAGNIDAMIDPVKNILKPLGI